MIRLYRSASGGWCFWIKRQHQVYYGDWDVRADWMGWHIKGWKWKRL